jgi:hypothetical protein
MIGERLPALLFHPAIDREASGADGNHRGHSQRVASLRFRTAPGSETGETRQDG